MAYKGLMRMTTWNGVAGKLFASVPEVASIIGRDEMTIRKAAEKGEIPARRSAPGG